MRTPRVWMAFTTAFALVACVGTTGGEIVDFPAAAAGAPDAASPLSFESRTIAGRTWHVTLTKATLHIGAVYLDVAAPVSGAGDVSCILPGTYVGEVLSELDVDLLDPNPQLFASMGHGTTTPARVGQVWLTGGDINAVSSSTPMLVVSGTADDDGGAHVPFQGTITIGANRASPDATTGANPICKQRIVSPIPTTATVQRTGSLLVRIDARRLFDNVDFAQLEPISGGGGFAFSDNPISPTYTQPSINLYANLRTSGPYTFSFGSQP